jgi:DNA-binding response OmpR family regulator
MRSHPAILSAEDLLEQVWDENTDPFTNTVSVTISRLRKKLGDRPVIETIPNIGYQIIGPPETSPIPEGMHKPQPT